MSFLLIISYTYYNGKKAARQLQKGANFRSGSIENSTWFSEKTDAIMGDIERRGFADERSDNAGETDRTTV